MKSIFCVFPCWACVYVCVDIFLLVARPWSAACSVEPSSICVFCVINHSRAVTSFSLSPPLTGIFNEDFWDSLDGVTNALDNVDARRYVDEKFATLTHSIVFQV